MCVIMPTHCSLRATAGKGSERMISLMSINANAQRLVMFPDAEESNSPQSRGAPKYSVELAQAAEAIFVRLLFLRGTVLFVLLCSNLLALTTPETFCSMQNFDDLALPLSQVARLPTIYPYSSPRVNNPLTLFPKDQR